MFIYSKIRGEKRLTLPTLVLTPVYECDRDQGRLISVHNDGKVRSLLRALGRLQNGGVVRRFRLLWEYALRLQTLPTSWR